MLNPFIPIINSLLPEPHASLLNGILFGVKASMPKDFYQALVDTGTLHIIALSGVNITILTNLLARITLFLGRRFSVLISISGIFMFVLFVGPSPSVVRAALMGGISLLAIFFGRQRIALLSWTLAASVMLLFNIKLLQNISFQLSVLATLGIILAGGNVQTVKKHSVLTQFRYGIIQNLRLTLAAQIFTLPIILYNFHRISLIAPVANLLTGFVIPPVMGLGFIVGILGFIWWQLGMVSAWILWVPLTYFITVVTWLAKVPGASIQF